MSPNFVMLVMKTNIPHVREYCYSALAPPLKL